jgi:hypothetical protein
MSANLPSVTHTEVDSGFEDALASIADRIREQREKRMKVAEALVRVKGVNLAGFDGFVEPSLVNQVEIDPLSDITVAGVDGGLLEQKLHGIDLILVRALAAIFHYSNAELKWAEYLPNRAPSPKLIDVAEPLDSREFEFLTNVERQLIEIEVAITVVKESSVGLLLLDGSVLPQYVDRFSHSQLLLGKYQRLIKSYVELYGLCASSGVLLAGAVKDSRGSRLMDILRNRVAPSIRNFGLGQGDLAILERSRDAALVDHLLRTGERTMTFTYADKSSSHVMEDLGQWGEKAHVFYMKTVPFDQPLRVEFINNSGPPAETACKLASLVYALSSHHDAFGIPSVLVEADASVRLAEEDLCIVRDSITDRLDHLTLQELRRNRRPF